jgi:gluconokinase
VVDAPPAEGFSVLACSALKRDYRRQLGVGLPGVALVYLKGSAELLESRLQARRGHYMKPAMLASQLAILEEPSANEAFAISIENEPAAIVIAIQTALDLHFPGRPPE